LEHQFHAKERNDRSPQSVRFVLEVLRQTRGALSEPSGAAARFGLKRTTLQYKIQKLGITRMIISIESKAESSSVVPAGRR
jgi:transcriptional regulator with GAF, ATPase, and Fis domain